VSSPEPASYRDAFDFLAAVQAPFRMQPGLRRLTEGSRQLHPNARDSRHLLEKLQALGMPEPPALQCVPGYDPTPGLHGLAAHAAAEHPTAFGWDGQIAHARRLGWSVRDGELRPMAHDLAPMPEVGDCLARLSPAWRLAGLLSLAFAEDFALIDARTARIPWLAVALPSHWMPEHKVGLHFAQVHAPVADNAMLLAASDALARLVGAPTRWERFVWTVTPRPTLNAHPALPPAAHWQATDTDGVAAQAWWRTERQTFIPAPDAGLAMFTILVDTQPLAQAIDRADKAQRLHDAIASMSPAVLQYRSLGPVRDALLDWLARRAAA
jgi:dimethylamine monooxygenase subunit A